MPTGTSFASSEPASEFSDDFNTSLGASWTSQLDDSTMAISGTASPSAPQAQAPVENITPGQRMVSATAGNVLTGLLGESDGAHNFNSSTNSPSHTFGRRASPFTIPIPNS